jgi:hypothetical protein
LSEPVVRELSWRVVSMSAKAPQLLSAFHWTVAKRFKTGGFGHPSGLTHRGQDSGCIRWVC